MSQNHKKRCRALNYLENFSYFVFTLSGFVSISAFGVAIGTGSSAVG